MRKMLLKHTFVLLAAVSLTVGCGLKMTTSNPYEESLNTLSIALTAPEGYEYISLGGVELQISNISSDAVFSATTGSDGTASLLLPNGLYRIEAGALIEDEQFNAAKSRVSLNGETVELQLPLIHAKTGDIIIKEVYNGGCMKLPAEGTYQGDAYIILHNNSENTVYLDSLCFGVVDPYNSTSTPVWDEDRGFCPVIQAVWQFPGNGRDHPLEPGEDAVLAIYGAINHKEQYPLSVNLNNEDYYVCYSSVYFPNEHYHPVPGDKIRSDHFLSCVIKTGIATAYTFSVTSPATIIFRIKGMSTREFLASSDNVIQKPGNNNDKIVKVPNEWVEDGMEVFNGQSSNNKKRLDSEVDAGAVTLSINYEGRTLVRKVNESRSERLGREVLVDTNNSSNDFYESPTQSLNKEDE